MRVWLRPRYLQHVQGPVAVGDVVYRPAGGGVLQTDPGAGVPYGRADESIEAAFVGQILVQIGVDG